MNLLNQKFQNAVKKDENFAASNPIARSNVNINNGGMLIFPDGARISYNNINSKNIYAIISKYSDYLHPDMTGMNSLIKHKLGRLAVTFKDGKASIAIGKINSMGFEYMYKMRYFDDNNLDASYYYPNKNYEELTIKSGKCIVNSYNALHQLVRMEETTGKQSNVYEINPETNDIRCILA